MRPLSRRGFLKAGAAVAAAGMSNRSGRLLAEIARSEDSAAASRARVVLIRHRDAVTDDGRTDGPVVHHMLNQAVQHLLQTESPVQAWRRLVGDAEAVGIKSNVWRRLPTPPELEDAIREEVIAAGVPAESVDVDDRGVRSNPIFQRVLASDTGALINVRPMRTHHWSGLGTCLKNPIMFVPRPADYHDDACAPIGKFWQELGLRDKTKLNILVMLTPQFHGVGPHSFSERFVWPYKGLIVGVDPVAVDTVGAKIIEARRLEFFGEERPISPPPHHIRYADTRYHLGVSDLDRIDIVRLGWDEGVLI